MESHNRELLGMVACLTARHKKKPRRPDPLPFPTEPVAPLAPSKQMHLGLEGTGTQLDLFEPEGRLEELDYHRAMARYEIQALAAALSCHRATGHRGDFENEK